MPPQCVADPLWRCPALLVLQQSRLTVKCLSDVLPVVCCASESADDLLTVCIVTAAGFSHCLSMHLWFFHELALGYFLHRPSMFVFGICKLLVSAARFVVRAVHLLAPPLATGLLQTLKSKNNNYSTKVNQLSGYLHCLHCV